MPSRADLRRAIELGLRLVGAGALLVAALLAFLARNDRPRTRILAPSALPGFLAAASPDSVALLADTALDPVHRDWLAAERAIGRGVRWIGDSIPSIALAVEPVADPAGGDRVLVAAGPAGRLTLTDTAGPVDSAVAAAGGAAFLVPRLAGSARARSGIQSAVAARTDTLATRRIVVLGRPSWETKFVIAALEERGWLVDARIPLSPDTAMVQGVPIRLDTSRVAAVVALDEAAVRAATALTAFVRQGGGVILGPAAAADRNFAALRVGAPGSRMLPAMLEVGVADPRRALGLRPITSLAPDAIPLEQRGGAVAVAAHRVGSGRIVQVGYEESWRWRMSGPEGAVAAHRRWWSGLVASVAYRATLPVAGTVPSHDAPLARMVARLGPADSALRAPGGQGGRRVRWPDWWLCALGLGALLAEWASRRLRGAA